MKSPTGRFNSSDSLGLALFSTLVPEAKNYAPSVTIWWASKAVCALGWRLWHGQLPWPSKLSPGARNFSLLVPQC